MSKAKAYEATREWLISTLDGPSEFFREGRFMMRLAAICLAASIEGDCDLLGEACENRDEESLEVVILIDESILYDDKLMKIDY
jgi:hypothetical protein